MRATVWPWSGMMPANSRHLRLESIGSKPSPQRRYWQQEISSQCAYTLNILELVTYLFARVSRNSCSEALRDTYFPSRCSPAAEMRFSLCALIHQQQPRRPQKDFSTGYTLTAQVQMLQKPISNNAFTEKYDVGVINLVF